jgi:N utilization substance protein B
VVIDEALELARRYSNEESVQFVNGVLDAVHRDLDREQNNGAAQSAACPQSDEPVH